MSIYFFKDKIDVYIALRGTAPIKNKTHLLENLNAF